MEQKLNKSGNRRGMFRSENYCPMPKSHPWFRSPYGQAQFKTPEGFVKGKFEDMSLPCPHDICDGSGEWFDDLERHVCLCKTDKELQESY